MIDVNDLSEEVCCVKLGIFIIDVNFYYENNY